MTPITPEAMLLHLIQQEMEADPVAFADEARTHAESLPWWAWKRRRFWYRWSDLALNLSDD